MVCNKCDLDRELSDFSKRSDTISGYRTICKDCDRERLKLWRSLNRDKTKKYKRNYRSSEVNKNKEKDYYKKYSQKESSKISRFLRDKERYNNDKVYRLKKVLRTLIKQSISNRGYRKESNTSIILGCSFEEFKLYLESKFESWMSWDNHGLYNGEFNYGWDIDHIIPASSASSEEEILRLNHYTNLQPLCSKINRDIKKNNLTY